MHRTVSARARSLPNRSLSDTTRAPDARATSDASCSTRPAMTSAGTPDSGHRRAPIRPPSPAVRWRRRPLRRSPPPDWSRSTSANPSSSVTTWYPDRRLPPRATIAPPNPPAAPAPATVRTSMPNSRSYSSGQSVEPHLEGGDLSRVGPLLRSEAPSRIDESHLDIAGPEQLHLPEAARLLDGLESPQPPVGGGRATQPDHDGRVPSVAPEVEVVYEPPSRSPLGPAAIATLPRRGSGLPRRSAPRSPSTSLRPASFLPAPPASIRPDARAISMTASPPMRNHAASVGVPPGPVTSTVCSVPPRLGENIEQAPRPRRTGASGTPTTRERLRPWPSPPTPAGPRRFPGTCQERRAIPVVGSRPRGPRRPRWPATTARRSPLPCSTSRWRGRSSISSTSRTGSARSATGRASTPRLASA